MTSAGMAVFILVTYSRTPTSDRASLLTHGRGSAKRRKETRACSRPFRSEGGLPIDDAQLSILW